MKDSARFENSQKESGLGKRGNIKIKWLQFQAGGAIKWNLSVADEVFLSH